MPKLFITALIVFFPVMVNAVVGFRSVNPWALELLHSLAASPWEVFLKLRLPSSLPYLFAAFKVSIPLSVIGAVVAEWFSGEDGLGRVIQVSNSNLDMPTAFARYRLAGCDGHRPLPDHIVSRATAAVLARVNDRPIKECARMMRLGLRLATLLALFTSWHRLRQR